MQSEQKRGMSLGYFNLARGVGMILIVLGHSINLYLTPSVNLSPDSAPALFSGAGGVLGGGMMAAFFMISGIGFFRRSFRKCVSIQRRLLLKPYCLAAAAVLLTKLLLALVKRRSFFAHGGELVLTYLLGLNAEGGGEFLGIPVESVSIFWFVLALFGGWIIYNTISFLDSEVLRYGCAAVCAVLGYQMTLISRVWPYCIHIAFLAAGYLAAGEFIKKRGLLDRRIRAGWWILIWAVLAVCAAFGQVNIVAGVWRLGLLDVLGSFCAGFVILKGYALFMRREHDGKAAGILEEIGFHSIWIICLHAYEKVIFPWYRVAAALPDSPWLGVALCFGGRCAVMYLLYKIVTGAAGMVRDRRFGRSGLSGRISEEEKKQSDGE